MHHPIDNTKPLDYKNDAKIESSTQEYRSSPSKTMSPKTHDSERLIPDKVIEDDFKHDTAKEKVSLTDSSVAERMNLSLNSYYSISPTKFNHMPMVYPVTDPPKRRGRPPKRKDYSDLSFFKDNMHMVNSSLPQGHSDVKTPTLLPNGVYLPPGVSIRLNRCWYHTDSVGFQ